MEIARQIQQQLAKGQLFDAGQLREKLVDAVRQIRFSAEKEFELLAFFESLLQLKQIKPSNIDVKILDVGQMLEKAGALAVQLQVPPQGLKSLEEQNLLLLDLHNAVSALCVLGDEMRQNRLRLVADMVEQLERAGALKE